jgi:hypothetical protein
MPTRKCSVHSYLQPIACNRLSGVKIRLPDQKILVLFNVYMPCDTQTCGTKLNGFIEVTDEISVLIHKLNPDYFIIGGDFNANLDRQSPQVGAFRSFLTTNNCDQSISDIYKQI